MELSKVGEAAISLRTIRAVRRYGFAACHRALIDSIEGYGAAGIAFNRGFDRSTSADAAIDAARELADVMQKHVGKSPKFWKWMAKHSA